MQENKSVVYILTNPSFPDYVKVGYTTNLDKRIKSLNNSSVPFSFQKYAIYEVDEKNFDKKIHKIIDKINPDLRSIEKVNGRKKKREFYHTSAEEMYEIFTTIADIRNEKNKLYICEETKEGKLEKEEARKLKKNRHHFKNIKFYSSLTDKYYYSRTNEDGALGIIDAKTKIEVPNNSNPSKKQILKQALLDLKGVVEEKDTLYQIQHKLEKIIMKSN